MLTDIVRTALAHRNIVLAVAAALLVGGLYAFHVLDIIAYPDPSPPMIEVITQNPGWSAEEMERQVTIPLETVLNAMPRLTTLRSISIFGLSDIKAYFEFDSDYFRDRQEVLNRLQLIVLPNNLQPQISPWSAIGEIYRYQLAGSGASLIQLKEAQDWVARRQFKQVPGVLDVTGFGGLTKEYHVEIDPRELINYGVTLPQVMSAISNSNLNVGGSYLPIGEQNANIRGLGLFRSTEDIEKVVVGEKNGVPIYVSNVGRVSIGHAIRLGKVAHNDQDDVVEGIVLMHRGEKSLPVVNGVRAKVKELNDRLLPLGTKIQTIYDRSDLINITTDTVVHILVLGIVLVCGILFVFLGDITTALIVAVSIPLSLLATFSIMVMRGESANLISMGAVDFGIIVDASVIMAENIFRHFAETHFRRQGSTSTVLRASKEVGSPIFFSTLIILIAFLPLFTMHGVPGRIFAPMSHTYGYAMASALLIAVTLTPVLCWWLLPGKERREETAVVHALKVKYLLILDRVLQHRGLVVAVAGVLLAGTLMATLLLGGEFMPKLEEGNLWIRATMPLDISFEKASELEEQMRTILRQIPELTSVTSQLGRPDDGTDVTGFFNCEFNVQLKPRRDWRPALTSKETLVQEAERKLKVIPGVVYNFSQVIQDNVEEAMSGVKGENAIKVFGDDLELLEQKAEKIVHVMKEIPGVRDLGYLDEIGQPDLNIQLDRTAAARYGIQVGDIAAVIQAALGGQALTQVLEGDRRFDVTVRLKPEFRTNLQEIQRIQIGSPDGSRIPLQQLATIQIQSGAYMIFREGNRRYIAIKFSVRGRDLVSTIDEAEAKIASAVELPRGYTYEWYGEIRQLREEQRRLIFIVPVSLLLIFFLLYNAFESFKEALLIIVAVPFALIGGVLALLLTGTHFSISAAVGFLSVFGVSILDGTILITYIRQLRKEGLGLEEAVRRGAEMRIRPVLMTGLAAAIGLLPAAIGGGIGSETQRPLARVVVGGMLTASTLILLVLPALHSLVSREPGPRPDAEGIAAHVSE
jgi:cobalt-zinc-cadmium resistance protein CzcA